MTILAHLRLADIASIPCTSLRAFQTLVLEAQPKASDAGGDLRLNSKSQKQGYMLLQMPCKHGSRKKRQVRDAAAPHPVVSAMDGIQTAKLPSHMQTTCCICHVLRTTGLVLRAMILLEQQRL